MTRIISPGMAVTFDDPMMQPRIKTKMIVCANRDDLGRSDVWVCHFIEEPQGRLVEYVIRSPCRMCDENVLTLDIHKDYLRSERYIIEEVPS